jgi:recombination protein RecR
MNAIHKLTELFTRFPGIGPRQARRFVYFLLAQNSAYREELITLLRSLKQEISLCPSCRRFFAGKGAKNAFCTVCVSQSRDRSLLMIVEKDVDADAVEKSGTYEGLYFILGGTVPLLEKDTGGEIRMKELEGTLAERVEKDKLAEVILALSATPDGEHTSDMVASRLRPLAEKHSFKLTVLGRGLSTGTELEYSDPDTIKNALKNRA